MPREFRALGLRGLKSRSSVPLKVSLDILSVRDGSLYSGFGLGFRFLRVIWDNNLHGVALESFSGYFFKHLLFSHFSMHESPVKMQIMVQGTWEEPGILHFSQALR